MKQFTSEEIQAQFEKLPPEVQTAVTSSDVNEKIEAIAKKYDLHIDQLGELVDEVGLVMLGLQKPDLFVSDLCERLSINKDIANKISTDINAEIFSLIRQHLMKMSSMAEASTTPSDLERLGDFTIDNTQTARNDMSPLGRINGGDSEEKGEDSIEKRPEILENIENPQSATRTYVAKTPEIHSEPLVDHLLTTPVTVPPQKIDQSAKIIPPTPIKKPGPDPYREAVN